MRNIELLERTMVFIRDHPEQHDQNEYVNDCGSRACFAGWAALLSGWTVEDIQNSYPEKAIGIELLGLTLLEAYILFDDDNTRDELELMVKNLVNDDEMRDTGHYHVSAL